MHRISLDNTVFEGANNCYVLGADAAGPTTLVDTGVAFPDTRSQFEGGLGDAGLRMGDVDRLLLTHFHEDHAGLAGEVQAAGGAAVHVHADDAPLVARDPDAVADKRDRERALFDDWGMPPEKQEALAPILDTEGLEGENVPEVEPFTGGDRFDAGEWTLEVVALPGHTAGSCGFAADGTLFSGDAVLPHYTPNVGGADVRVERALATYLDTLASVVGADYDRAYPGHRAPIEDPTARAREIFDHHRDRTRNVVDALREHGPADAWTVSARLFGELEEIHILHGPGEAHAHLEHLVEHGLAERSDEGYALADPDPEIDATFPDLP